MEASSPDSTDILTEPTSENTTPFASPAPECLPRLRTNPTPSRRRLDGDAAAGADLITRIKKRHPKKEKNNDQEFPIARKAEHTNGHHLRTTKKIHAEKGADKQSTMVGDLLNADASAPFDEPIRKTGTDLQTRKGHDRHTTYARKVALENVVPKISLEEETLVFKNKTYVGIHWFNLSPAFKLILVAELVQDRMSMNGAMNLLRMDVEERKDYFQTFDADEDNYYIPSGGYLATEHDFQKALRFVTHRVESKGRASRLLQTARKYIGKLVVPPIETSEYTDLDRITASDDDNASEESLFIADGKYDEPIPEPTSNESGISTWPVVCVREIAQIRSTSSQWDNTVTEFEDYNEKPMTAVRPRWHSLLNNSEVENDMEQEVRLQEEREFMSFISN